MPKAAIGREPSSVPRDAMSFFAIRILLLFLKTKC